MISFVCKDECVYENHYDYSVYLVYVHEPYIVALSDWEHLFFGFHVFCKNNYSSLPIPTL